ncbi:hypothetical protein E5988_15090, partial [Sphingomonas olei]
FFDADHPATGVPFPRRSTILPLRKRSQLEEERCRTAILDLSDGNTGRIFRLVETLAVRAIENGTEQIEVGDLDADDLVLPSVSMKALAQRRGRGRAKAAAA